MDVITVGSAGIVGLSCSEGAGQSDLKKGKSGMRKNLEEDVRICMIGIDWTL